MKGMMTALAALMSAGMTAGTAQAQAPAVASPTAANAVADPAAPRGRLPDAARPLAYRLDLTVLPEAERFTGHAEIDTQVTRASRSLYLHGLDLAVTRVTATAGGRTFAARYTQVDPTGVARLDFDAPLAPGRVTLTFDYTAPFRTGSEGLYHAKVGEDWYAWTQMEPIDARRMFPGFDEPGFKVPFSVAITARAGQKVFANTPETSATPAANGMVRHVFAASKPLPTYLVAIAVGPFDVVVGNAPPNAVRKTALPYRVLATKGQAARMQVAAVEGPRILALHEDYFGSPYPFEKLDQIASPVMGGAMENAGLVTYNDTLLLLGADAPPSQRRGFGTVVAHELAHQWFGDLVTPVWWTDIWLNESFAEWAGNRVGEIWQPGLGTDVLQLADALDAMDTDSRAAGRPIRQPIERNDQIASAFDSITYQKGGQVLTMVERYLGPDKFRRGVQFHLNKFRYANASAEDFFASMAQGSGDAGIVPVFQSFVSQTGVPVIAIARGKDGWQLTQSRYRPIGVAAGAPQRWTVPFCLRQGETRTCTLMTGDSAAVRLTGGAPAVPNADGAGYYRYSMDDTGWRALLAGAAALPAREAMAAGDSLWADFAAGNAAFARVLDGARALAAHPNRVAATQLSSPLGRLASNTLSSQATRGYRALIASLYAPRLAPLGTDLTRDAYAKEDAERRQLRQSMVALMALEARDPALRTTLATAATASLGGTAAALDPSFRQLALTVAVQDRGVPFMNQLRDALVASEDPLFRQQAVQALAAVETRDQAARAIAISTDPALQSLERVYLAFGMAGQPAGRDALFERLSSGFDALVADVPAFSRARLPSLFSGYCAADKADAVDRLIRPRLATLGGGELELAQTLDAIRSCVALKAAKGAEIEAALTR